MDKAYSLADIKNFDEDEIDEYSEGIEKLNKAIEKYNDAELKMIVEYIPPILINPGKTSQKTTVHFM